MSRIPFPPLSQKDLANLHALEGISPLTYFKFEFNKDSSGRLFTLPIGRVLKFDSYIFIENVFDVTTLYLGTTDNRGELLSASFLTSQGIPQITVGNLGGLRTTKDTPIFIGYSGVATKGRGWGIIQFLDWSKM